MKLYLSVRGFILRIPKEVLQIQNKVKNNPVLKTSKRL